MLSNSKKGLVIACIDVIIVISAQNVVLPCIAEIEEIKRRKSIFVFESSICTVWGTRVGFLLVWTVLGSKQGSTPDLYTVFPVRRVCQTVSALPIASPQSPFSV